MKTHLFTYRFRGEAYSFEVPADTQLEASDRLNAICLSAQYTGELATDYDRFNEYNPHRMLWEGIKSVFSEWWACVRQRPKQVAP